MQEKMLKLIANLEQQNKQLREELKEANYLKAHGSGDDLEDAQADDGIEAVASTSDLQAIELDGLSVSYGSYQDNPLIVFMRPQKRPFQFGVSKAKRLVAGIECCTEEEFSQALSDFVEKGAQTEIKIPSVKLGDWQGRPVLQFYSSVECSGQPFSFGKSKAEAILAFVTQTSVEKLHSVLAEFIDTKS